MPSYEYSVKISLVPQPADPGDIDAAMAALRQSFTPTKENKWARLMLVLQTDNISDFRNLLGSFFQSEMPNDIIGASNWEVQDPFPPPPGYIWLVGPQGLHTIIPSRFNYRIGGGAYQQWQVSYTGTSGPQTAPIWIDAHFARTMVIP